MSRMYYSEDNFQWCVVLTVKVITSFKQLPRCMAGVELMLQSIKTNFLVVVLQCLAQ